MKLDAMMRLFEGTIATEDGTVAICEWRGPVARGALQAIERRLRRRLPTDYRSFLRATGGGSLFGLDLVAPLGLCAMDLNTIPFHAWGNGDFDCLRYDNDGRFRNIVFVNHSPLVAVMIASSFFEWLTNVIQELHTWGTLLHPRDYRSTNRRGLYSGVLEELKGKQCELNRQP